jgi:hypothetical protein
MLIGVYPLLLFVFLKKKDEEDEKRLKGVKRKRRKTDKINPKNVDCV